jgi:hypothetical protein
MADHNMVLSVQVELLVEWIPESLLFLRLLGIWRTTSTQDFLLQDRHLLQYAANLIPLFNALTFNGVQLVLVLLTKVSMHLHQATAASTRVFSSCLIFMVGLARSAWTSCRVACETDSSATWCSSACTCAEVSKVVDSNLCCRRDPLPSVQMTFPTDDGIPLRHSDDQP